MNDFVLTLDSPLATLALAGGKGANLSQLIRAGFPTPGGFLLTTDAYHAFVAANGLDETIAAHLHDLPENDFAALEAASIAIRQRFEQGSIPDDLAAAILTAYEALAASAVAVRSSATAEDLPEASFAGQQDTYLNIRGPQPLLDAVRRCWSSLWTARAIAYRRRQAIPPESVSLAVVVQEMIPAEAAGILFTLNPVTGNRDEMLLNAAWGLGEAIVGGLVTPDSMVLDRESGQVKAVELGDKALMTAPSAEGTEAVSVAEALRDAQVLTDVQAAELARLGREIEAHFGAAQDIEWAMAGGRAYILQARPVTAISAPTEGHAAPPGDDAWLQMDERPVQPFDLWTQSDVGERFTEPVTPLTASMVPHAMEKTFDFVFRAAPLPLVSQTRWQKRFFGRLYFNEGAINEMSEAMGMSNPLGGEVERYRAVTWKSRRARVAHTLELLLAMPAMMAAAATDERAFEALLSEAPGWVEEFLRQNLSAESDRVLGERWQGLWWERYVRVLCLYSSWSSGAMLYYGILEKLVERWTGLKEQGTILLSGLPGLVTMEMGPALQAIARQLQAAGLAEVALQASPAQALAELRARPEAQPAMAAFDAFLARYGHARHCAEELRYPRWVEAPEQVMEMVAGYLRAGDSVDLARLETRQAQQRAATVAVIEARLNPLQRLIFQKVLARTQHLVLTRDNGRESLLRLLLPFRRLLLEFGRRWQARGWLREQDDIFFLTKDEVGKLARTGEPGSVAPDLGALIAARRQAYEYWFTVTPPAMLDRYGQPINEAERGLGLSGIPASGGQVTGPARIVHDPSEATRLQPGDILVTRATDPAWTPVFPLISGLVMEVGGQLSHGAIVAREYGIPAVTNVVGATQQLQDGQRITVDGTRGKVVVS